MTHHTLKAHPPMFWALKDGTKTFNVRKDGYVVLALRELKD